MLVVASLKRSLEFDPVKQGVKRKRATMKLPSSPPPSPFNMNSSLSPSKQKSTSSTNDAISTKTPAINAPLSSSTDDIPMFTNLQTAQICARLLRDQDRSIREQYEQILVSKLTEQYDTFVRYSHDNIHKKPAKSVSCFMDLSQESSTTNLASDFSYVS